MTDSLAAQFEALADRAAVQFPARLDIQAAACALLGSWALKNRALIAAALRGGEERYAYRESARDWTEDYPHDNGQYLNTCRSCGAAFCGYKRRVTCRVCANPAAPLPPSPGAGGE